MKILHRNSFFKLLLLAIFMHCGFSSQAQLSASVHYKDTLYSTFHSISETQPDLLSNHAAEVKPLLTRATRKFKLLEESDRELQKNIASTLSKADERKLLMDYLKQLDVDDKLGGNQANKKIFYRFANLFARLKMYPLAMKCYFKTITQDKKKSILNDRSATIAALNNDSTLSEQLIISGDNLDDLPINEKDDSLITKQSELVKAERSKATTYERIASTFNDNKKAVAYAMLFHVKQPVPGKRKIFVFSNTGHTFITLIKYNADSTYVSCSFGFYPKKDQPFAATPVFPSSPATLKNDSGHLWDEVVGKFISKKKFERILTLTKKYDDLEYHLSKNNCTDFCLQAATLAGININETKGKWPLGSGNNPGVTGQSLLHGNFDNADPNASGTLFSTINLSVLP